MERPAWPGSALAQPPYEALGEEAPSAVVTVEPPPAPPPRDHLAWSLCTALYSNACCLGILALVFSVKARDRKLLGDYSGALSYGSTAKYLNITALLLNIFFTILVIALLASGTIVLRNFFNHRQDFGPYGGPT